MRCRVYVYQTYVPGLCWETYSFDRSSEPKRGRSLGLRVEYQLTCFELLVSASTAQWTLCPSSGKSRSLNELRPIYIKRSSITHKQPPQTPQSMTGSLARAFRALGARSGSTRGSAFWGLKVSQGRGSYEGISQASPALSVGFWSTLALFSFGLLIIWST